MKFNNVHSLTEIEDDYDWIYKCNELGYIIEHKRDEYRNILYPNSEDGFIMNYSKIVIK
jgi:hypothetical protein